MVCRVVRAVYHCRESTMSTVSPALVDIARAITCYWPSSSNTNVKIASSMAPHAHWFVAASAIRTSTGGQPKKLAKLKQIIAQIICAVVLECRQILIHVSTTTPLRIRRPHNNQNNTTHYVLVALHLAERLTVDLIDFRDTCKNILLKSKRISGSTKHSFHVSRQFG